MKRLSLLTTLLLTSSMVYAGWTRYEFDPATGVYKTAPKYSCLEMICEHDCVENSETGEGECCPDPETGTNCVSDVRNEYNCLLKKKNCETGQYCNQSSKTCQAIPSCSTCQKFDTLKAKCVADTTKNNQQVQDACHKCLDGQMQLKNVNNTFVCGTECCNKNQRCNKGKCEDLVPRIGHWTFCGYPGWGIWEIHSGGPYSVDLVLKGELYYVDDILYVYVDGKQKFTHSSYNYGCSDSKCAKHWSVDIPKGAKWSVKLYNGGKNLACAPGKTWLELPK